MRFIGDIYASGTFSNILKNYAEACLSQARPPGAMPVIILNSPFLERPQDRRHVPNRQCHSPLDSFADVPKGVPTEAWGGR